MNVLTSITVLGFLIFFHEMGHFLAAILQGIYVDGFSIGFGPSIIKKKYKNITYSFRAFPLGGFVSFPDEEINNIDPKDPNLLKNRPIIQRVIVISAGVFANLILAYTILVLNVTTIGIPFDPEPGILVLATQPDKAASIAGLQAGDKIIKIETNPLGIGDQAVSTLVENIQNSSEKPISLEIDRDGVFKEITLVPKNINGKGTIGAQLQPNLRKETKKTKNFFEIIKYSNNEFTSLLIKTIQGYKGLITNFASTAQQLSGPVKIVEIGAQLSEQGGTGILLFAALISINLAVLNSLPLPLLDGGQLVFTLIEGFRGKPVPVKVQMAVTQSSFFLLVGLSVLLIIRDTSQLLIVQRLLNQ
ncbi:RIP metalloprotease RseP [Prochlorococcus marinus XMU1411]|uniref:RIP metalloprotease RseP n=1 Tax=Prochlorococcus marinus TaxID=1219 RepID=UPI001ADC7ED1|nr:RIP metalloprotease RseP [Prochlorococcus marinus]MBO8244188.1 RIP metalloprotease RseP [Prochlorococcus marinus XMU1411]MBW3055272.1 RIP metalloprotease RseP [Prochlorococcus marinus str. MU1411]MCR8537015.1 RIP metalloprotease RseP [Prochlorococcus marinus CUG1430]